MNKKYNCNICNYHSNNLCNFNKHLGTKKHVRRSTEYSLLKKEESLPKKEEGLPKKEDKKLQKNMGTTCEYCMKYITKKNISRHKNMCKKYIEIQREKKSAEKEVIINKLMKELEKEKNELKKEKKENQKYIEELKEKSIELRDIEKEYMDFMRQVVKYGKNVTKIKAVNMYFIKQEYNDAINYEDLINPPLTIEEIDDVKQYGGIQGCYDIIYGRCIDGIDIERRPFHCVDDSRNKYLLRIKDRWKVDKKGSKILEVIYPRVANICVPDPTKIDKEYDVWKEQNIRMNELANGKNKIIKMLNDVTLIKNNVLLEK